jgi:hypothetical protein
MIKRVLAVAAAVVAAFAALGSGAPASAQTYPPPVRSITVDDTTPAPGQSLTITLRTCKAGTIALLGIDLKLVATPTVGADGAARATVTVPARIRPGRHVVSGACLTPELRPLFLTTVITVSGPGGGGGPAGGGGGAAAIPPPAGGDGASSGAPAPGGAAAAPSGATSGGRPAAPSLDGLAGPGAPSDAAVLFGDTAAANGITGDGVTEGGDGIATAQRSGATSPQSGSDPGPLATIARVTLGVAALGGVPVALAISRRPRRAVRRGFAT